MFSAQFVENRLTDYQPSHMHEHHCGACCRYIHGDLTIRQIRHLARCGRPCAKSLTLAPPSVMPALASAAGPSSRMTDEATKLRPGSIVRTSRLKTLVDQTDPQGSLSREL
jgi:hypothetical protein